MKVVGRFPNEIREIENCWIPMADGCRLAARIWLPADAEQLPVPAIIEYIPYRKRDGTRWRDEPMHAYFSGHGYAVVRIDLRGSGDSDGLLLDEYLEQEQDDGIEAIGWVAAQPWCTGAVGMMGKSWGGFNALQVAARRPDALKAIITVCSTDDRYADDAHFMGGCLLNENLTWGALFFTMNALAPDPELVGPRWREMWLERLGSNPLFPALWLRHPHRDEYWRHGSVCEDFSQITCPVYAIGGWADGYSNAVPRLLAGLHVPRKGLVGPWAHLYPHEARPGPAIGFLQEALRWWDHWLKQQDTGIMDEPMYRVWMQESVLPRAAFDERPGRWVAEPRWPRLDEQRRCYWFRPGQLMDEPTSQAGELLTCRSPQTTGLGAGSWCSFGADGELPADQREDDGKSLCFDSAPLAERLEILGAPTVTLSVQVDRPVAMLAVRLNDVFPDGTSARVTYGLLNLTHRESHERPSPLVPGEIYRVQIPLNDVAHAFPAGHLVRLAVSTTYWPLAWPAPRPVMLRLATAGCTLELPVRTARSEDETLRPFERPEGAPPLEAVDLHESVFRREVHRDLTTGETVYTSQMDMRPSGRPAMSRVEPISLEVGHGIHERFSIGDEDPLSAHAEIVHKTEARRNGWRTRIETRLDVKADVDAFRLRAELHAFEGDEEIFVRHWDERITRDLV